MLAVEELLRIPTENESMEYYAKIAQAFSKIEVRYDAGYGKGKGVFATQDLKVGDVIFEEDPLVAIQTILSTKCTLTCDHCLNYVGSMFDQVKWHVEKMLGAKNVDVSEDERQKLESMKVASNHKGDQIFRCRNLCGAKYCSEECCSAAWDVHHWALCPRQESQVACEWLEMFYDHAKKTNEVFILAAQAIAKVFMEARRFVVQGVEEDDALLKAWEPFLHGQKALWWECVSKPDDLEYSEEPLFRKELEEVASDSLTLFSHAMELGHPSIFKSFRVLFDLRIWASLIGMFELNNLLISAKCPLSNPSADEVSLISEITKRYPQPQSRDENEDMASVKNWVLDGSGFYRIHSCMNHSCKPNCKARTPRGIEDNAKVVLEVTEPIKKGSEISISYIDCDNDLQQRQADLRDYGFFCACDRCDAER